MNSRRQVLFGIAATPALASVEAGVEPHGHQHVEDAPATGGYTPKVFSAADLATIGALAETILPRTGTPGALDAKVHEIIDENLSSRRSAVGAWQKGLKDVSTLSRKMYREEYTALSAGDQAAVMTELAAKNKFFQTLKDATCDAYYSTKEGLNVELGWDAAKPMASFAGCTHKEHQV
jgi:hypothetical protein